jgi:hypothetical protein
MPTTRTASAPKAYATTLSPPEGRYDYDKIELAPCPDAPPSGNWELSGSFWEGRFKGQKLVEHRNRYYGSRRALDQVTSKLRESRELELPNYYGLQRRVSLREAGGGLEDWWGYGLNAGPSFGRSNLTTPYIPLLPGPATRQLYWADYFAMSAKAFEAYQHNPIAHGTVEIATDFILGRGVECKVKSDRGQEVWDEFWTRNNMDERLEWIYGDLVVYGEIFLRYFETSPGQLTLRSLDPAGIYEILTDQEDWETVYFYHQQEQERSQLFAPPAGNQAPTGPTTRATTRYVVRQIAAEEIDHYRINARSSEVRGRSDLFPALGYLKRLQDLLTSRVIRADMQARMVYDLCVKGNSSDVNRQKTNIFPKGEAPEPGSIIAHNEEVELAALQFQSQSGQANDPSVEEMVVMCALGTGMSREYIWPAMHGGSVRAGALVATEPAAKRFQRRQRHVERILSRMAERVFGAAGLQGDDADIEFILPSIAVEERSATLKDLAFLEANGWFSKETSATIAARSFDAVTYDFDEEQQSIIAEWENTQDKETDDGKILGPDGKPLEKAAQGGKIRRPMIVAQYRQSPKLDPTKASSAEDQPPGLLMPGGNEAGPPGTQVPPTAPTRAGFPGDENPLSGAGASNIRRDNSAQGGQRGNVGGGMTGPMRESEMTTLERLTMAAIREASRGRARIPRRKPDDPDFEDAVSHYHERSDEHVRELGEQIRKSSNGKR